jgi:ABC-2 type transport system ATP-binding protein
MTEVFNLNTNIDLAAQFAIVTDKLTKLFGETAVVQDLSFQIPFGKIFGFIGPSGCGKTTTVRLLTGIYKPSSGEALVLGAHPGSYTVKTRAKIGYMPQLFDLYPDLSVWENMNFAASLYGLGFFRRRKKLIQLLDFVELNEHKNKLARNISGGMQRRLSLAATLIHSPELIFLDEPTAGIDPILRQKFWDHFNDLKSQGRTLFITTQYVGEAANCDFVGIMANGRLLMVDTPEGLRRRAFGGEVIDIQTTQVLSLETIAQIEKMPFVRHRISFLGNNTLRIIVEAANSALPDLLSWFQEQQIEVESAKEFLPPFDDVFVKIVQGEENNV